MAKFLGVELTGKKLAALGKRVAFEAMAGRGVQMLRKGVIGEYKRHLSVEQWASVDVLFEDKLGGKPAMAPLRQYM